MKNSGSGLVVEPKNPEQMAKAIISLYQNRELREVMGTKGRKYAVSHFDRGKLLGELEERLIEIGKRETY